MREGDVPCRLLERVEGGKNFFLKKIFTMGRGPKRNTKEKQAFCQMLQNEAKQGGTMTVAVQTPDDACFASIIVRFPRRTCVHTL